MNYLKPKKFNKINEKMFSRHGIQDVSGLISIIYEKRGCRERGKEMAEDQILESSAILLCYFYISFVVYPTDLSVMKEVIHLLLLIS